MTPQELIELISEGESSKVEFKRKTSTVAKIAKEISAFANTKGGFLIIGVDDDGSIVGVHSEKSEIDLIENACEFYIDPPITPLIEVVNINHSDIVVAQIKEGHRKPHCILLEDKDSNKKIRRAYIRIGEKSIMASRGMYRLMTYENDDSKQLKLSIGEKEKRLFAYLSMHEKATVKDFARLVNISTRRAERLMIRLVRAGVLQIHNESTTDYYTLVGE